MAATLCQGKAQTCQFGHQVHQVQMVKERCPGLIRMERADSPKLVKVRVQVRERAERWVLVLVVLGLERVEQRGERA